MTNKMFFLHHCLSALHGPRPLQRTVRHMAEDSTQKMVKEWEGE